jgi:two-component system response regulator FixJ
MMRHIYLLEEEDAVRASLYRLLSQQSNFIVRSFRTGDAFLDDAEMLDPGVLLLDFHMSGLNGIDVLHALRDGGLTKFVPVILIAQGNMAFAVEAMKTGALDVLEKPYEAGMLLRVIDGAFSRLAHNTASAAHADSAKAKLGALSPRERDVLMCLIEGRANKVIARDLNISPRTVEIYRANLRIKLGVRSLPEALLIAISAGLIPPP